MIDWAGWAGAACEQFGGGGQPGQASQAGQPQPRTAVEAALKVLFGQSVFAGMELGEGLWQRA